MAALQNDLSAPLRLNDHVKAWLPNLALALAGGWALRDVLALAPLWWMACVVPVPLLVAVVRARSRMEALVLATLAGLVGASVNLDYLHIVMGLPAALGVLVLQALGWTLVLGLSRRVIVRGSVVPAFLAYPLLCAAFDLLSARFLPDGNWGSVGYSLAGYLPAAQLAGLGGVPLVVFIMSLFPSALAVLILRGKPERTNLLIAWFVGSVFLAWGGQRTSSPMAPAGTAVGLASIDDAIGPHATPAYAERIWQQYEQHIATLAARGARIVVLPEKIAMFGPGQPVAPVQQRLARAAAQAHVWLVAGVGYEVNGARYNRGWLFAPDGALAQDYEKQKMAPREREFVRGHAPAVQDIAGQRLGLAICKDMHFADVGRGYAQLAAHAVMVPAWDFGLDGKYAARLSALRGIEGGYAMVRVSRDGYMTITDAYGRIFGETATAPLPGATMLGWIPAGSPPTPLYARIGDAFGWLALGLCGLMFVRRRGAAPAS